VNCAAAGTNLRRRTAQSRKAHAGFESFGQKCSHLPDVDVIVSHVAQQAQGGDIVVVFSNGGFGGIHARLLERLGRRQSKRSSRHGWREMVPNLTPDPFLAVIICLTI
jgi:UDP-N-acetylmuramate-alanine ligase